MQKFIDLNKCNGVRQKFLIQERQKNQFGVIKYL